MGNLCKQYFLFLLIFAATIQLLSMRIRFRSRQCDATSWISWLTFSSPPPLRYTAFCSAKWKSETGAKWKVIFFTLLQKQPPCCFFMWEILLLISTGDWNVYCVTAHHCGLGFNRYDLCQGLGGLFWYIKYLCNNFLFVSFFLFFKH